MTKQTRIFLVRHGQSESNKLQVINGHSDPDLTAEGINQVQNTRDVLKGIEFEEVYSSNLIRAIRTAEIISGKTLAHDRKLHILRERNFGSLDGQPESVVSEANQARLKMSHDESWHFKHAHDVESDHELAARVIPALEKIAKDNSGKTVLVVGHGGAIRSSLMKIANLNYKQFPPGTFPNAGYAELEYSPESGFRVIQISGVKL